MPVGVRMVAKVNSSAKAVTSLSMMVTAWRSDGRSSMPQNRAVSTDAPMPMPIQQMWNRLMNWPASEEAESCASPMELSMMVSIRLMPTVINDCSMMGMAMRAIFL